MKKFLIIFGFIICCFSMENVYAAGLRVSINSEITNSGLNKGAISISVKDLKTGKTVYSLNPNMPVSPASMQKLVTLTPAAEVLGADYRFKTSLYKDNEENYMIVLGADPYLTTKELKKLVKIISKTPNSISIDSTAIDSNEWGEGWQWDDDLNVHMPKFSVYNLDKNLVKIIIRPTVKGFPAEIVMEKAYPMSFKNKIITDKKTNYTLKRQNYISPDVIEADGTIDASINEIRKIPVCNPKKYFEYRLTDCILDKNISSSGVYPSKKLNSQYKLLTYISHDFQRAEEDILKNSDNLVSETVFKLAGGKYKSQTGSFENGLEMLKDFCLKQKIDMSEIKIVDASGVSKNNLMIANFMTEFLIKNQAYLEPRLTTAGEGTLTNRMLYLKDMVRAKTGTLNNISSIAGYITSRKNNKYVFCIMINDSRSTEADKKVLEEYILRAIYRKG